MKILKIILFNFVLILFSCLLIEAISYLIYYEKTKEILLVKNNAGFIQKFRYTKAHKFSAEYFNHLFSKHINKFTTKRPVLLIGCSYVQGCGLEEKQTLAYKLFEQTKRSVYKRGFPGGGIQLSLDQFNTGIMKKEVPDAEYIIYLYLNYHIQRLYDYQLDYIETEINQRYILKNGKLIKIKQPIFPYYYSLFSVKMMQEFLSAKRSIPEYDNYALLNAVLMDLLKQSKQIYKNSKFIILLYPDGELKDKKRTKDDILPKYELTKLEQMGFIVINAEDLTNKPIRTDEYRVEDKDHPNEKVWDTIVPPLIKKLNL